MLIASAGCWEWVEACPLGTSARDFSSCIFSRQLVSGSWLDVLAQHMPHALIFCLSFSSPLPSVKSISSFPYHCNERKSTAMCKYHLCSNTRKVPGFILPPRGGFSYWLLLAKERCSTHDAREDISSFRTDTGHIGVTICTHTLQCGFLGEWVISKFHPCPLLSHSPALSCWIQPQPQLSPLTVPLTSLLDPQSGKTRQGTCWEDRLQRGSGGWRMNDSD